MVNGKIRLASPTMHGDEVAYIEEAFARNWVAPLGFNCDGFEDETVSYLKNAGKGFGGALHAMCLVSGTSALHLAIKLVGVKAGDVVLCSDMTFSATVNPVSYEGGVQVFVDSERDTWNMSPDALEAAFLKYPSAKVVVLAHLYGTPAKIDEIFAVCEKHGAVLIEDAAEALSATYKGHACGTFGKYAALSYNGNKIITTSGGGMLLTHDKKDRDKALFWATQSRENAPWYQHDEIGYNYRMSNIVAGIGRGQMKHLDEHKAGKMKIYRRYAEGFCDLPVKMNPFLADSEPNFWLSCMTVNPDAMCECTRTANTTAWKHQTGKTCPDEIAAKLSEINAESRPIWKPMHLQPVFCGNDFISVEGDVGADIFSRGICLPSDINMTAEEQKLVIETVKACFR